MKYTSNYNLKKPEGTDIVNIDDLNYNADILDQKLKEVENKADNAPPNSVNDAAIGSRTPDQSQAPASPGTGTLTQLVSWLANRIKAITGKTNWWDAPPTTLQAAKTHMDAAAPHSGHETPAGAQAKAEAAAGAVQDELDAHVSEIATLEELGHVKHAVLSATLDTTWSGSATPYTKTVTVSGILATDTPIIDIVMSGTYSTDEARIEAWGYIYRAVTDNDSITFYATEKPTVSLPIQIKVVR